MGIFRSWKKVRNERFADDPEQVSDDLLLSDDASLLAETLRGQNMESKMEANISRKHCTSGLLRDMHSRNPNFVASWIPGLTCLKTVLMCSKSYMQVELALTARVPRGLYERRRSTDVGARTAGE